MHRFLLETDTKPCSLGDGGVSCFAGGCFVVLPGGCARNRVVNLHGFTLMPFNMSRLLNPIG